MDTGGGVPGFGKGWPAFAAAATWVLTLFATAVQATVPSSASPIAPPTCWAVLSRLEATPESCSATLCRATRGQRDEHQAEPERAHERRAEQMAGVAGVLGQPGVPEHPGSPASGVHQGLRHCG